MDRRDARLALELARQWAREGLLPPASLAALEQRHGAQAREADDPDRESFGSGVLYGLGGILLGAAIFAVLVLLEDRGVIGRDRMDDVAPWLFLGWGALCAAGALLLDLVARKPRLGDALHVAALLAVTAAAFPRGEDLPLHFVSLAYAFGILAYRRTRFLVPFLALVAFNVAFAGLLWSEYLLQDEETLFTLWFVYAAAHLVALIAATRLPAWPWPTLALAGATLLLAGTFLGFFLDTVSERIDNWPGDVEVYLAFLMGAALATGLWLREKGMVLAAALVIAIDAVVFAFEVGDIVGGLVAILTVAGLLIWQAGALRRYLREA